MPPRERITIVVLLGRLCLSGCKGYPWALCARPLKFQAHSRAIAIAFSKHKYQTVTSDSFVLKPTNTKNLGVKYPPKQTCLFSFVHLHSFELTQWPNIATTLLSSVAKGCTCDQSFVIWRREALCIVTQTRHIYCNSVLATRHSDCLAHWISFTGVLSVDVLLPWVFMANCVYSLCCLCLTSPASLS